jgi:outer membrane lipoprotein-sorting protein
MPGGRHRAERVMAGKGRGILIAALALGLAASAGPAAAETVPLPKDGPQKRNAAPLPPADVGSVKPAPGGSSLPTWFPTNFGGKSKEDEPAKTTTVFSPEQRALVDKVSAYLSGVQVMSGDFTQVGPDGRRTTGQFFIQKPGKVRFEYDPPSPIDIVADGSSVVVRDRKLATQDLYPLSQTPLRYLLADHIDLLHDTNVASVTADDTYITVVVEEKQRLIGTSRLMMMFSAKDLALKQWVVTDPQGLDTTVAVSNIDSKRKPDPDLFKIDYTQYRN